MKRKLAILILTILLSGIGVAAYAFNSMNATTASCCACCKDSCPMKTGDAAKDSAAKCDCCDGDSCPMMNGKKDSAMHSETTEQASADGKSMDCPCCKRHSAKKDAGN